jgi:hypothetical protein
MNIKSKNRQFTVHLCLWSLVAVLLSSCSDFLNIDQYFNDELKIDSVFSEKRYVEAYMWGTAAMFPDEANIYQNNYTPGPLTTDEAFSLFEKGASALWGAAFVLGTINADNIGSTTMATWGNLYKIIRKCNTIFARIDEAVDMTATERQRILAYTRFIRAYAYYNIIVDFGPPLLLGDEILNTNEAIEYYDCMRSTYDEAADYICTELEAAAVFLPLKSSTLDFGRPTKGAAYGLVARLRLIQASPLFNGGQAARTYFGSWKRKTDGVNYVSQTYNEERWAIAAAAAKRVMDLEDAGLPVYSLYTVKADNKTPVLPNNVTSDPNYHNVFPDGAAGIDPFRSYSEIFNGEAVAVVNPEFVWARNSTRVNDFNSKVFAPIINSGYNSISVPQKIIDAYCMKDGHTIYDSSVEYSYSETGFTGGNALVSFSGYQWTPTGQVYNMYINREARFYASIGFSECFWPNSSTTTIGQYNQTITYYYDSPNGKGGTNVKTDFPITGYVLKKFTNPQDSWSGTNAQRTAKVFPIIRYAEILLSYAEALNNLTGSHQVTIDGQQQTFTRDVAEIKKAFNQVRYRAGLPGMSNAEAGSAQTVQALLERERMVELLHENRRYFDVRRWGKYEESENETITGMNTDAMRDGFYQRVVPNTVFIGNRVVSKRLVFVPIPRAEIKKLPSLDQNPGWD